MVNERLQYISPDKRTGQWVVRLPPKHPYLHTYHGAKSRTCSSKELAIQVRSEVLDDFNRFLKEHHPNAPLVLLYNTRRGRPRVEVHTENMQTLVRSVLRSFGPSVLRSFGPLFVRFVGYCIYFEGVCVCI
jgi:hypothetical protein